MSPTDISRSLHKEIADFYEFVRPHDYEEAVRLDLIDRVRKVIRSAPNRVGGPATVELRSFGSFASGLYLPTADMDLVALSPGYLRTGVKNFCQSKTKIFILSGHIGASGLAAPGTISTVVNAKVPIIKFTDNQTGIKVDISFESDSGLVANQTFLDWKAKYPAMPVIVVLIKQMLAMRDLNEVFSGGLGGFSIICLVVSMMQLMPELQSGSMDQQRHYSDLLLTFLDLYGNKFNIKTTGIIMEPPGYYDKLKYPRPTQNKENLTIIDPNNPANDISGGSRNIEIVLECFRRAHSAIQGRLAQVNSGKNVHESILGCIWGGDYSSFIHQRNKLSLIHRGHSVSPPPIDAKEQYERPGKRRRRPPPPSEEPRQTRPPRQQKQPAPASTQQRRPPPPSRQDPEPPHPVKQQVQQGKNQHPLPQKPVDAVGAGPRPNKKGYVDLFIAPKSEESN